MALDDDKFILASMQRSLRKQKNWQIETFFDPVCALESAHQQQYDLFLSDYQMPGIDGIEFLTKIKSLQPSATSIILSGQNDQELIKKAIKVAGIYRFVTKPVKNDELIKVISSALQYYEAKQSNEKQESCRFRDSHPRA